MIGGGRLPPRHAAPAAPTTTTTSKTTTATRRNKTYLKPTQVLYIVSCHSSICWIANSHKSNRSQKNKETWKNTPPLEELVGVGLVLNSDAMIVFTNTKHNLYHICKHKSRSIVDINYLDASSMLGRLERWLWTSTTTCSMFPSLPKSSKVVWKGPVKVFWCYRDRCCCFTIHPTSGGRLLVAKFSVLWLDHHRASIGRASWWMARWSHSHLNMVWSFGTTVLYNNSSWKLAMHFASSPRDGWIQWILRKTLGGRQIAGCLRYNWVTNCFSFARFCPMATFGTKPGGLVPSEEQFVQFCKR